MLAGGRLIGHGGELRLALGESPVKRIIELSGLHRVMPIFDDVDQSLAS